MATTIRTNVRLAEFYGLKKTIFDHVPDASGAADYEELAREFMAAETAELLHEQQKNDRLRIARNRQCERGRQPGPPAIRSG
jgi:hypothetical protein